MNNPETFSGTLDKHVCASQRRFKGFSPIFTLEADKNNIKGARKMEIYLCQGYAGLSLAKH